jgi:hypothetical protein
MSPSGPAPVSRVDPGFAVYRYPYAVLRLVGVALSLPAAAWTGIRRYAVMRLPGGP